MKWKIENKKSLVIYVLISRYNSHPNCLEQLRKVHVLIQYLFSYSPVALVDSFRNIDP